MGFEIYQPLLKKVFGGLVYNIWSYKLQEWKTFCVSYGNLLA